MEELDYVDLHRVKQRLLKLEKRKETLLDSGELTLDLIANLCRIEVQINKLLELTIQLRCLPKRRRVEQ